MAMIRALWAHRRTILDNIKREFRTKYRNALLGATWNAINRKYLARILTIVKIKKPHFEGIAWIDPSVAVELQ